MVLVVHWRSLTISACALALLGHCICLALQAPKPDAQAVSADVIPYLHARSVVDFTRGELLERVPELKKLEFADNPQILTEVLAKTAAKVEPLPKEDENL